MKIVALSPSFSKNTVLRKELLQAFPNTTFNDEGKRFTQSELIEYMKDADGAIVGLETINAAVLEQLPKLKIISKYGVGLNNIDLKECEKRNITIGWCGGVNRLSVAEMALGFMLMLCRNLYTTSNTLKEGTWNKNGGIQLSGKTVGIIGVGHIGKEVIRLLKPFGCKILVCDIIDQTQYYKENDLIEVSQEEIFKHSDVISLHVPFDESTENLISLSSFKLMKSSAFVLNTARGGIINENDLKYALTHKLIAGAAVDAYVIEPPDDQELISLPNLICTPHIGGDAQEAILAMGISAIKYVKEFKQK